MRTYSDSLWIDPKGATYHCDCHHEWVEKNWNTHFGKRSPALEEDIYAKPYRDGWARVRNVDDELAIGVNPQRITRSQKIVIRAILDEDHERTLYVDAWIHDGDRKPKDKILTDYDQIVDYLSQ